jgi:predicted Zn-dependent protease
LIRSVALCCAPRLNRSVPRVAAIGIALALTTAAWAHPEIEEALARIDELLQADAKNAALYLQRGDLNAQHNDLIAADRDFRHAAQLSPDLKGLDCARGSLALAKGRLPEARAFFDRAVQANASDAEALVLRAKTLDELGERAAALADLNAALERIATPAPDLFLARSRLCSNSADAIRSLDEGIQRIGPVPSLLLRALMLEQKAGRTDAALARLDALIAESERKESWLKMRGDVLAKAQRPAEARQSYAAARDAIRRLPDWLQQSPDLIQLAAEMDRLSHN